MKTTTKNAMKENVFLEKRILTSGYFDVSASCTMRFRRNDVLSFIRGLKISMHDYYYKRIFFLLFFFEE